MQSRPMVIDHMPHQSDQKRQVTSLDILTAAFEVPGTLVPRPLPSQAGLILEDLSKTFVDSWDYVRTGEFSVQPIAAQIDADFTAAYDGWFGGSRLEDFLQTHRMIAARFPGLKISVLDTCAHIADSGNRADVYVLTETTGAPTQLRKQGLGVLKWRRREGVWYCYRMQGLRGVGGVI
ncbi:hypothetical protein M409DRAFT_51629 [Zasmidium cellare ATCC 36951]|uniref:SnoaL-like domain-containing protein n=1 Tax=Zasmidium cellare ATCC 36951 TaxID=1080233 RepID=A0A6A6CU55_ZASCE|nr:uncharacterized protein M409DRAFT_51629 [Zasmidium cellare ATCC 36951]KAF2170621.1 hypothetical protein M409DRAFT_51629 [Zasmidium cellare ATCC 36951]